MKSRRALLRSIDVFMFLMIATADFSANGPMNNPIPVDKYLGQKPPADIAVVFAPGIVSKGDVHGRLAISPAGNEMCWTSLTALSAEAVPSILCTSIVNGKWTSPQSPSFADHKFAANPLFLPDGNKLLFDSIENQSEGLRTRYSTRTNSGWTEPKTDGFLPDTSSSFTTSGRVYFSDRMSGKPWNSGIYSADFTPQGYRDPAPLGTTVNSSFIDYTPFVSQDETYLLFSSSRPSMQENMFLYVAFRQKNGTWSTAQKLNQTMAFAGNARFPSISPDGKYLFFCGDDGNIYWVSIKVVEKLRPHE